MKSQQEQALRAQVEQVRGKMRDLAADLQAVDDEFESLAPQRTHHGLLDQACGSLEQLGKLGAGSLFWGERMEPARIAEQLREVRGRLSAFKARLDAIEERRRTIRAAIEGEEQKLEILGEDLYSIRAAEERKKSAWIVEREISPVPRRVQQMAWARGGEDDRRYHKTLAVSMGVSLLLGLLLPMIEVPPPRRLEADEMPERIVQFMRQEKARPLPPPPVVAKPTDQAPPEQEQPKPEEPKPPKEKEQPVPEAPEAAVAQATPPGSPPPGAPGPEPGPAARVGKAGILAFKDKFASLTQDKVAPRLGRDARYGSAADAAPASSRSMLTTNAPGSSRGINLSSLSRGLGGGGGGGGGALHGDGGGGGGMQGVEIGRATSSIAGIGGGDRPLASGGPGPARTDEEIQIVFDRYKAAFYRIYNRELRKDPTLRGQMVLRLTIEPDGSVSMCVLQSTDMNAPDLAAQVVKIVLTISFGAKEGVKALTIAYPIDFLPAA